MSFDFQKVRDSKDAYRSKLAALPIGEKLRLLDAMRERALAIRGESLGAAEPSRLGEEPDENRVNRPKRTPNADTDPET